MSSSEPLLHVVLYQPDIPQNTGNIGRTCVAVGAKLWLVRPLGFRLDEKHLRRAGMDYWPLLDFEAVETRGIPASILAENPGRNLKLPMRKEVRSLNLASTVNTVVYEAVRQFGGIPEE